MPDSNANSERNSRGRRLRLFGVVAAALVACLFAAVSVFGQTASSPTLSTDQADYSPEQVVHVTGSGFDPNKTYAIPVQRPNGTIVKGDGSFTPGWDTATADDSGNLTYDYQLDGVQGSYEVRAYPANWSGDWSQTPITSVTFTDSTIPNSVSVQNWQTKNGGGWVVGTLAQNNSDYKEGETVPYRIDLGTLATGPNPYTVAICRDYQLTSGGKTITGYNFLNPFNTSRPATPDGPITSTSAPFSGVNINITNVSETGGQGSCNAGQRETVVTFNATTTGPQYLLWGGHLSSPNDPGVGEGHSASFWPGGSLQMRLQSPDKTGGINPNGIIQLAHITVTKVVDSGSATPDQWCFNISPNTGGVTLPLCPAPGTNSVTFSGLTSGNYTITETNVAGYQFASGNGTNCTFSGSTATASVTAAAGGATNASCTFHNAIKPGTVDIIKKTDPAGAPGSFAFTTPDLPGGGFSLSDGGDHTANNVAPGTYHVTESNPNPNFDLSNLSCDDANSGVDPSDSSGRTALIKVEAGEHVTCTYTNTQRGSITVVKQTKPGGDPTKFNFTGDLAGNISDGQSLTSQVKPGSYSTTENVPSGWDLTNIVCSDGDSSGDTSTGKTTYNVSPGENVTCTYTDTERGSITVVKQTKPGGDPTKFNFTGDLAGNISDGQSLTSQVKPGSYSTTENVPSGWDLTNIVCSDGDSSGDTSTGKTTYNVSPGENVTCTYTDTERGSITVKKLTVPSSDTTKFNFTGALSGNIGNGEQIGPNQVAPGTYSTTETIPTGWALTQIQCSDSDSSGDTTSGKATFKVAPGENVTCTYTNSRLPTLTVKKHVVNDNGGSAVAANWDIHVKSGSTEVPGSPQAGSESGTTYTLTPGTYTASETGGPAGGGYSFDGFSLACDSSGSVTLAYGQDKTCRLTNNDNPATIVIQKNAKPQNGTFSFTTSGSSSGPGAAWPANFTLTGSTSGGGNVKSFTVDAGKYTVKEGTQLSWVLTGIGGSSDPNNPFNCTVTGPNGTSTGVGDLTTQTVTIAIKNGDTVTCVFENTGNGATRTQGFWATHPELADIAWNGGSAFGHTFPGVANTPGIGDSQLCGKTLTIDGFAPATAGNSEVMGGFWADVSKTSTGKKRSALSQAKMQLLQQLLAAELNASAFGSTPNTGSFSAWEAAFCGSDLNAVKDAQQQAASFNSKGDSSTFTPGTSADSKFARKIANLAFWDYLN